MHVYYFAVVTMQRRTFVKVAGGASMIGLAGCTSDDDDGNENGNGGNGNGNGGNGNGNGNGGDSFPSEDLRFVVPYSAGGGSDTYARQIASVLQEVRDVTITVENHEGSGGMIGTNELVGAGRNGHDILTHNLPTIALEYLQQDIDIFDIDDLRGAAIATYATTPRMTVKNPDLDIDTYEELIERQDEIAYGTPGGTELGILQIARELHGFEPATHVQYDGGNPAGQAAASGEVDVASAPEGSFQGAVGSGDIEPLFTWSSQGSNIFDGVPTIADEEQGGFEPFDWLSETGRALWTNPEASEEALEWWESAIEDVMTSDQMQEWSDETGQNIQFDGRETTNASFVDALEGLEEDLDLEDL